MKVEGKDYVVVENMGYVHDRGCYAKVVEDNGKERMVIKQGRKWYFARPLLASRGAMTGQGSVISVKKEGER